LVVFVLLLLFPLINIFVFACGAAIVYFNASQTATIAANSTSHEAALGAIESAGKSLSSSDWLKAAKIQPIGGFANSGMDLFVVATEIKTSRTTIGLANRSWPTKVDTDKMGYEYLLRSNVNVGPFLNLPVNSPLDGIPIVGKATPISMSFNRQIEHPDGLAQ